MTRTQERLWTAADLAALPDDGFRRELVKGHLVVMPPTSGPHGSAESDLGIDIGLAARHLGGIAYVGETGFNLTRPGEERETVLAADVAYIARRPVPLDDHGYVARAPDLAVEFVSPGQSRREMQNKARIWIERGVRLLWLIWPTDGTVEVWHPGDRQPGASLGPGDGLDGEEVLPGFSYPVAAIQAATRDHQPRQSCSVDRHP